MASAAASSRRKASIDATDSAQLLALMVAQTALDEAEKATNGTIDRKRTSCILGVASATELVGHMSGRLQRPSWVKGLREAGLPETQVQAIADKISENFSEWKESTFPGLLGNVVAGRIANQMRPAPHPSRRCTAPSMSFAPVIATLSSPAVSTR